MKATILPLIGKYYGTEIEIEFDDGHKEYMKLWDSADYEPSIRQLGKYSISQQQWDNNEVVEYDGYKDTAHNICEICDNHFESKTTYERAIAIKNKLETN